MMKKAIFILCLLLAAPHLVFSHCEIPCGIYDDKARIKMLQEHILTVEKSMENIIELSKAKEVNYNQLVRWIDNKEKHAGYIQEIVSQYFMTQRIKPLGEKEEGYQKYIKQITLLHEMLIYAMKAKQGTDLSVIKTLKSLVAEFDKTYFD